MTVGKERGNLPVGADRLQVEFLVFVEVDEGEQGLDLSKAPFDTDTVLCAFFVVR